MTVTVFSPPPLLQLADDYHLRTMDAFLAVVLTCISTFLWRGLWGFFDKIVLPGDPPVSSAISLVSTVDADSGVFSWNCLMYEYVYVGLFQPNIFQL